MSYQAGSSRQGPRGEEKEGGRENRGLYWILARSTCSSETDPEDGLVEQK